MGSVPDLADLLLATDLQQAEDVDVNSLPALSDLSSLLSTRERSSTPAAVST